VRIVRQAPHVALDGVGQLIATVAGREAGATRTFTPPLEISAVDDRLRVVDAKGDVWLTPTRTAIVLRSASDEPIRVQDSPIAGDLLIQPHDADSLDVIERTTIERYLPGVLAAELYPSWSEASYRAQAVAARSYALHERARRRALGSSFDIEGSTRDQAYAGASASPTAQRAVERTHGVALTYQGRILRAYYSSTCGGHPASAADTWPTGPGFSFNLAPPIQASPRHHYCEFSPRYRWRATRDRARLAQRIAAFGRARDLGVKNLDGLTHMAPIERNDAGRPAEYGIYDRDGKRWRLSAEQLRLALNASSEQMDEPASDQRAFSGDVRVRMVGDEAIIDGRGFGHGVGMCQFGAEGLARDGAGMFEILRFFYPGAEIERVY